MFGHNSSKNTLIESLIDKLCFNKLADVHLEDSNIRMNDS